MPKKAHTEEQIVAVLRQGEAGEKVAELLIHSYQSNSCGVIKYSQTAYHYWQIWQMLLEPEMLE